jgi:hypothetical protein
MSENLNVLSEKVGEVNRAVSTALSNASVAMDGVMQTLHRQQHVERLMNDLQNGRLSLANAHGELEVLAGRCPSILSSKSSLDEHYRNLGIVAAEFKELYELVEKLRGLEAASVDPDGSATEAAF